MNMNDFQTRDFSLAAFLMTLGFPLLGTRRRGSSLIFCFPSTAADAAPGYLRGEKVSARAFYSSVKDLKSLIHSRCPSTDRMKMKDEDYKEPYAHI